MKKIIFALFLLTFSLSFSNSDIDIISKELWRCPYSVDKTFKGLTYVKFLNKNGKPYISLSILNNRAALKIGKVSLELSQLDYEVKENENSIYFTNLNDKTQVFPITNCLIRLIKKIDLKWIYIVFQITKNFAIL